MTVRIQRHLPGPAQQGGEIRIPGGGYPQHQRVHKKAHQFIQRRRRASGHRDTDGNIIPRPQPMQQRHQTRLQHHKQARPLLLRQPQ